jgi:hypothetical protein
VPTVVMGPKRAQPHRENRLSTIQGLALTLFIGAEHQSVCADTGFYCLELMETCRRDELTLTDRAIAQPFDSATCQCYC